MNVFYSFLAIYSNNAKLQPKLGYNKQDIAEAVKRN